MGKKKQKGEVLTGHFLEGKKPINQSSSNFEKKRGEPYEKVGGRGEAGFLGTLVVKMILEKKDLPEMQKKFRGKERRVFYACGRGKAQDRPSKKG